MRREKPTLLQRVTAGLLMGALCAGTVLAAGGGALPTVHGQVIRDFARLTFEWPRPVPMTVTAKGTEVQIKFSEKAAPDMGKLLVSMAPYVVAAERKADGRTIVLTLNQPYRVRSFMSDGISGIDLVGVAPQEMTTAEAPPAPPPAPVAAVKPAPKPQKVATLPPAPKKGHVDASKAKLGTLAKLAPAAGEEAAPPATPAEPVVAVPAVAGDAEVIAKAMEKPVIKADTLKPILSTSEDSATIRFPFQERMAMAAFRRQGFLWVVFDKKLKTDLSEFEANTSTLIHSPSLIPTASGMALRFALSDSVSLSVAKEAGSTEWAVLLSPKPRPLANPVSIRLRVEDTAPAHVFVEALEIADPITVADPLIGDELIVIPDFTVGEAVAHTRDFVEFSLIASAQGLAVLKKADAIQAQVVRNGVRLTLPGGASLSTSLPDEIAPEKVEGLREDATFFDYASWQFDSRKKIKKHEAELLLQTASENPEEANTARLLLARHYLGEGMAAESVAMLDGINRTNPSYYRSEKLNAMRGAAHFLMYRFADAAKDFSAIELNNNLEADYWRNMLSELLGATNQSYEYLAMDARFISKYPPTFRQRLAIVSADRAIRQKDYNTALKIFDGLEKEKLLGPIDAYTNFLLSKIALETGKEEEARKTLELLSQDIDHPFVSASAKFTLLSDAIEKDSMDRADIIDQLERLRLRWHGDQLEQNILTALGSLYVDRREYINAMRVWQHGVMGFPGTPMALEMAQNMEKTFQMIFSEGGVDERLPALDSLSLYYEYRSYAPSDLGGDLMVERLADRLVSVDLLEQASTLLDFHMRNVVEKEKRSRVGAKLATIYLLNRDPVKAIDALKLSMYGENAQNLRVYRNRLSAEAMALQDQDEMALATLGSDDAIEAERIRIDVYWKQKDWPRLISSIERLLKSRADITAPVSLAESEYVIKLALAYQFENNQDQLQYLRDYFGPLMVKNPNKPMFEFVTSREVQPTPRNFDQVMANLSDTRTFLEKYQARVREGGLDPVVQ